MKKTVLFFLMLILISLLVSCGGKAGSLQGERQVIAALGAEPSILDAAKASDRYSFAVLEYINESLTMLQTEPDGTRKVLPALAETWEASADFTEWTFHLREAFWEDGKKITADDFVYSVRRFINKESASPMAMYYDYIKNAQAILKGELDYSAIGIKAADEKTLVITTENPVKNLDEFAADLPPQREDIIAKYGVAYGGEADTVIGCGAFKIKSWVHNSSIELVKNERFWNAENVKLQSLIFKIINEENAVLGELINGSVDIAPAYSINWINKLKAESGLHLITGMDSRVLYVFMNQKDALFSNKKIRQAVSASLDREEICRGLFDDIYKPIYGFVSFAAEIEGKNYRSLAGEPIKKLIEKVKNPHSLFAEGLREIGVENGKASITVMIPSNESSKFDEYLQQTLSEKLGVTVLIDKVEPAVFKKRNKSLDYQLGFKSWAGGSESPYRFLDLFLPGNKIVPMGWENKEYGELLFQSKHSDLFDEKLALAKRAEEILLVDECCIAPYANQTYNIFFRNNLKGVTQFKPAVYNLKYAYKE